MSKAYMPVVAKTVEWSTPWELVKKYGEFDLDPCATAENAKAPVYFTKEDDGLSKEWFGRVWLNPPYGREILFWTEKAMVELIAGRAQEVVMLLPARTDTRWFHKILGFGEHKIEFLKGRVKYGGNKNNAPFPSIVVTLTNTDI